MRRASLGLGLGLGLFLFAIVAVLGIAMVLAMNGQCNKKGNQTGAPLQWANGTTGQLFHGGSRIRILH